MEIPHERGWYWKKFGNQYDRHSVTEDQPYFAGWSVLLKLIEEAGRTNYYAKGKFLGEDSEEAVALKRTQLQHRDQALVACLFETGGRIIEVLNLRKSMFKIFPEYIQIEGMPIFKRYKKDKATGQTKRKNLIRSTIQLPLFEPLVPYITSWLEEVDDWLFPSYAKEKRKAKIMTETRAYIILRELGEKIGLHKYDPNILKDGKPLVINQHIHPHWFRSYRASQLAKEYHFRVHELKEFFGWEGLEMPVKYSKLAPTELLKRMSKEAISMEVIGA